MTGAGFVDVRFDAVVEPVYYGADVDAAYDLVMSLREPNRLVEALPADTRGGALRRLRAVLTEHWSAQDGVQFGSQAWIVSAQRPPG
jgi:hypothetical protein